MTEVLIKLAVYGLLGTVAIVSIIYMLCRLYKGMLEQTNKIEALPKEALIRGAGLLLMPMIFNLPFFDSVSYLRVLGDAGLGIGCSLVAIGLVAIYRAEIGASCRLRATNAKRVSAGRRLKGQVRTRMPNWYRRRNIE